jgi:peptidoglycan/LPS O-acetylase OafA/YrhL
VVLYHAGLAHLTGGYVGVDVFYVISGFLITDLLWREVDGAKALSFASFYARRARRLLPAAIVVLLVTLAWAAAVLPPLQVRSVWVDALYCAVYAGNFRFAATRTDYLANTAPSPFQHYWSLGVEEQFYLLWPLLLLAGSLVLWRRRPSRGAAVTTLAVVCAASLYLSATVTRSDQPVAFFLLPTRAWELGLGGLVALGSPWLRRIPPAIAAAVGWAGGAAILVACFTFGSTTPYPGTAALLPVAGSAAVIAAGLAAPAGGPVLALGHPAMRAMGRISYSWYLWHYPLLVLGPATAGHPLGGPARLGLAALSGVLAVLTFRFVEEPGRRAAWLATSPRRSLEVGLGLSAVAAVACLAVAATIPSTAGHGRAPVASIRQTSAPSPAVPAGRGAQGSAPVNPALTALDAAQAQVVAAVTSSAGTRNVPANLEPPLSSASSSEAAPMVDGCLVSYRSTSLPPCVFGDQAATRSVALFGDSHAAMWFPAVDAFAKAHHYRLLVWTKAACPPVAITLFSPVLDRTWTECQQWYANVLGAIAGARPSLVVLGIAPNYDAAYRVVQNGPAWLSGLTSTITAVRRSGARVLVLGSIPGPDATVPDCLSASLSDVPACDFSPAGHRVNGGGLVGVDQAGQAAEAAAVRAASGTFADVVPWFCTASLCDTIVDNLLVYRDNSHITVPYAEYLAPLVGDEMALALSG